MLARRFPLKALKAVAIPDPTPPPWEPSRRPKGRKHWVLSRSEPSQEPSQGVPEPSHFLVRDPQAGFAGG